MKNKRTSTLFKKTLIVTMMALMTFGLSTELQKVSAAESVPEQPEQLASNQCTRNTPNYKHIGLEYDIHNNHNDYYQDGIPYQGYQGVDPAAAWRAYNEDVATPEDFHSYFYAPNTGLPDYMTEDLRTLGVNKNDPYYTGAGFSSKGTVKSPDPDQYWVWVSAKPITSGSYITTEEGKKVQEADNHPDAKSYPYAVDPDGNEYYNEKMFVSSNNKYYKYRVPMESTYYLQTKTTDTRGPYATINSGDGVTAPKWKTGNISTSISFVNNYNDDANGASSSDTSYGDGSPATKYYGCNSTSTVEVYLKNVSSGALSNKSAWTKPAGDTTKYTVTYAPTNVASGKYNVYVKTLDGFNNDEYYTSTQQVWIDNTKPTVSISKTAGTEINGYYGYDLELTVNPTDDHSGVDYTTYNVYKNDVKVETITVQDDSSTDGDDIVIPLGEIALEHGSGTYHVTATTTDNVSLNSNSSNGAPVQSGDFPIDATGPVITMTPLNQPVGNGYYADLKVLVKADDDFSGVDSITYSVEKDGETIKNNTTVNDDEVTVNLGALADTHGTGTYTITATAEDRFGNVTTPAVTGSWKIDRTEPYVQFSPNGSGGQWVNSIDVVITPSDAHSGVSNYTIQQSYDNGQTWEDPVNVSGDQPTTLTLNMDGLNLIKVNVTDKAKIDSGQTTSNIYYIDTIAPVISTNITDEFIYGDEVIIRFPIFATEEEGIIGNGIYDPEGPSGTFSGIDHSSVVGIVDYTDNDGNQSTFEVQDGDVLTEDGYYELTITASDNAGNTTVLGDVNFEIHDRPTIDVDIDEETGNGGTEGSGGANNPNIDGGQGDLVYPNKPEIAIDEIVLGSGRDDAILEIYYQVQPIEEPIEYDVVHLGTVEGQDGVYDTTMYPIIPFTEEFVRSLEDGTHDIEFWVVDDKGLTSDIDTCQFKADTLAPLLDNTTNVLDYPESEVMVGPDSVLKMTIQTSDQESDDTRRPEFTGTPYEKSPYYNVSLSLYLHGEDDDGTKVESTVKKINELKTLDPTGDLVSGQNVLNNEPSESFVLKVEDYQTEINQLLSQGLTPVFSIELKVDDNRGNYTTLTSKEVYYDESMAY